MSGSNSTCTASCNSSRIPILPINAKGPLPNKRLLLSRVGERVARFACGHHSCRAVESRDVGHPQVIAAMINDLHNQRRSRWVGMGKMCDLLQIPSKSFLTKPIYEHILDGEQELVGEDCKFDLADWNL